jgi:SAM-dependent methyltransferase
MPTEILAVPDPDLVYGLYTGDYKVQLARIALRLDVFTPLANGPADAEAVAKACGCDATGARALLDYLTSLNLLERRGDVYALTPTADAFLVPGRKTYAGRVVTNETNPEEWERMWQAFRTGQPSRHAEDWAQDAWLESYSTWRPAKSLEMWRAAGVEPGRRPGLRLLDLACGCAVKSLVLARADPAVRVTCVDRAEVLVVARDLADRLHVTSQVTFQPGDLLADDFGENWFSAVLLGQISYYLAPAQNASLFQRIHKALAPGGKLVIDAIMASDSDTPAEEASLVTALMWAICGGAAHSFDRYKGWLTGAGFKNVNQLSERWLVAIK